MDVPAERARYVTPEEARAVSDDLKARGWHVIELPGGIADRHGFFKVINSAVRLNPPMQSLNNWDAFNDSLSDGLLDLGPTPVAIVWPDPEAMRASSSRDFDEVLRSLGSQTYLGGQEPTGPAAIRLIVGGQHPMGPDRAFEGGHVTFRDAD